MKKFYTNDDHELNRKLKQHEFSFKENAWEDMERRLDGRPKVSPLFAWLRALGIGLGLSAFAFASWCYLQPQKELPMPPVLLSQKQEQALQAASVQQQLTTVSITYAAQTKGLLQEKIEEKQQQDAAQEASAAQKEQDSKKGDSIAEAERSKKQSEKQKAAFLIIKEELTGAEPERIQAFLANTLQKKAEQATQEQYFEEPTLRIFVALPALSPGPLYSPEQEKELGAQSLAEQDPIVLEKKKSSPLRFGLQAGVSAGYFQHRRAYTASPLLGISANYDLDARQALSLTLQHKSIRNMQGAIWQPFSPQATAHLQAYPVFDNSSKKVKFYHEFAAIDMIEMPLRYEYRVLEQLRIGAGLRLGYLYNVRLPKGNELVASQSDIGIKNIDLGLTWSVQWAINEHIHLDLQAGLGLRNLSPTATAAPDQDMQAASKPFAEGGQHSEQAVQEERQSLDILIHEDEIKQDYLRMPTQLRNSDVQLSLRYIF